MSTEKQPGRAVVFVGPPHSGKSVFLAELYRQLLADKSVGDKAFLQRACPDGEGMWSAEADQALVKQIRQKGSFDAPTMNFFIQSIRGLRKTKPIVLVDCGGRRTNQNAVILSECTDAVILSSNPAEFEPWKEFCAANGVQVIAELKSELLTSEQRAELDACLKEGKTPPAELMSQVETGKLPFTGTMRDLDRDRPSVTYKDTLALVGSAMARELMENKEGREGEAARLKKL